MPEITKKFYRAVEKQDDQPHAPINYRKWLTKALLTICVLFLIWIVSLQAFSWAQRIASNWDEIKFAYEKPALVKVIREDYEQKQFKLEQSFLQKEETPQDKLVNEVVKKLQSK